MIKYMIIYILISLCNLLVNHMIDTIKLILKIIIIFNILKLKSCVIYISQDYL